ncbi:MAG: methylmalonyl-CoA mutase, partial [Chitinophagaceae bacterium]|nr:methylmalonyl-CoA mutase [Chitinophagaceae bacterium]
DTVDPLGGSYFIETLTNEVEQQAWQLIDKIDAMGGSVSAIEQGFVQNEIARSAYEYQRKIEDGEKIIVGLNKFQTDDDEQAIPAFRINDNIREQQIQKLRVLKEKRNKEDVQRCLSNIRQKAVDDENLMPAVIEGVENYCTLGEIADQLRNVFGEYK